MLELNKLYNLDCMSGMAEFPDGYFDLAICDPPYGIRIDEKMSKQKPRGGGWKFWTLWARLLSKGVGSRHPARRILSRA